MVNFFINEMPRRATGFFYCHLLCDCLECLKPAMQGMSWLNTEYIL